MKNQNAKKAAVIVVALSLAVRGVFADTSVGYSGGTYTQNFNSLATYSSATTLWSNNTTTPENIEPNVLPVALNIANGDPIDLTGSSMDNVPGTITNISNMSGWWAINQGGQNKVLNYNVSNGSSSTAALTAYFNPGLQGSGNNMALGVVAAAESGFVTFGVKLTNNSTNSYNAFTLSYKGQIFHQDIGEKNLTFGYTITSNGTAAIPTAAEFAVGSMNVGGFATAADPTGIGEASTGSSSTKALTISNNPMEQNWAPGQTLWLTWQMSQGGSGQGLAIDDLSFSATTTPVAPILNWNLSGSGTWDTTSANWSGSSGTTTFTNGIFNAFFGSISADANIVVNASGISLVNSVTFSNSIGTTYTISGGSIGGATASLNVVGTGTVKLTAPNSYGLATNLKGGILIVDNDNELGASTAVLNLKGGELKLAGNLPTTTRTLAVSSLGGTVDTTGFNASFAGSSTVTVSIQGTLVKTGAGDLNIGLQPKFGSLAAPAGHLDIEQGSVSIIGNGRSNAIDQFDGGTYNGNLILVNAARLNFDSGVFSGTGEIQVQTGSTWASSNTNAGVIQLSDGTTGTDTTVAGDVISNASGSLGGNIAVKIHLNSLEGTSGHPMFIRTDVSTATFVTNSAIPAGNFITVIGGTKAVNAGIGPQFSNLTISGVISGDSDINVGNDYKSGGSGNLHLDAQNTYHGVTMLNGGGTGLPVLYIDVNNALPTDTDVVFGNISGAGTPTIDLNGHSQTIRSLEVALGGNSPNLNAINNTGAGLAVLTINGDVTPFYGYTGQINDGGPVLTDGVGNPTSFGGGITALVKDGSSLLRLSIYLDSLHTGLSTYSGGTTVRDSGPIKGGSIEIPWDGALGASTGSVTFDGGKITVRTPDLQYDNDITHETSVSWTSSRLLTVTANGGTINTPTFTAFDTNNGAHTLVDSVLMTGNGSTSGYSWGGALQLTGSAGSNMTFNGGTGTVSVTTGASVIVTPTVAFSTGGTSDPFTDSVNATRHVAIQNNGTFTVNAGSKAIAALTGTGNTTINAGTSLTTSHIVQNSLTINGSATIRTNSSVSKLNSISLAHTGVGSTAAYSGLLQLNNNRMVLQTADSTSKAAAILSINEALFSGKGTAGTWTGTKGITSSTTAANKTQLTVGVFDNANIGRTNFGGGVGNVNPNSLLISPALLGDLNLDGKVDVNDLALLGSHWQQTGISGGISTMDMTQGDINQDGKVDVNDLALLGSNWQATSSFNLTASVIENGLGSGGGGFGLSPAQVPEPASLLMIALAVPLLLRRRKA